MPAKRSASDALSWGKSNGDKKRTNLKELLSRSTSSLLPNLRSKQQPDKNESDGEFVFKRSSSQMGSRDGSTPSSSNASKKQPKQPAKKIRRLRAEDMAITPDPKHRTPKRVQKKIEDDYEEESTSMQVALPISDTPIIRRNKAMRNGKAVRRSSMGKRGKRVSSIGNGFAAVPHEQVPTSELYKHLDSSLPDPHKMRQLLTWCAKRVLDEDKNQHVKQKNKLPSKELTALNIAKVIKEELVRDLVDGKINISWWNRAPEEDEDSGLSKNLVPNQRNVKNAEALEKLKQRLEVLKASSEQWGSNMSKLVELPNISFENAPQLSTDDDLQRVLDKSLINEISQMEESTFNDISQDLEFTLDSFNDLVHQLKSSSVVRKRFISHKSEALSHLLDTTIDDNTILKIDNNEHNRNLDTDQLLKGIAKLDR
jgi:kinetochore protein Mis13/DSN1